MAGQLWLVATAGDRLLVPPVRLSEPVRLDRLLRGPIPTKTSVAPASSPIVRSMDPGLVAPATYWSRPAGSACRGGEL